MIARVMSPGCKADSLLILEGPQGSLKSTACETLGGAWFSDALPDLETGKDCSQHLAGKWLVEFSEMVVATRADAARFKAFASRTTERYRRPYDRKEVHEPRQVVFIGTTNADCYLRDETGARRYWPVRVGRIDIDALRADREQLLAEALALFRKGMKWWPDADFEKTVIVPEQSDRFDEDEWESAVAKYVQDRTDVTIKEIAMESEISCESLLRLGTFEVSRIRKILRHLGWGAGKRLAHRRPWVPRAR
jgi:predicted P-loop ATPase